MGRPITAEKKPSFLYDTKLEAIANKYNKSAAQVVFRYLVSGTWHLFNFFSLYCIDKVNLFWQIDNGAVPIPKSVTPKRIEENIDVFDFKLTDDEIKYIDTFNTGERVIQFLESSTDKYFPFAIEF